LLENYKKLQAEYTKSRQELSGAKNEQLSDDEKAALDFLKNNGFATKDDLETLTRVQKQDTQLNEILLMNPDLQPYETAIRDLSKNHNSAPEDIIEKYGFKSKDKLAKAKSQ
jgi:hypothetical protein